MTRRRSGARLFVWIAALLLVGDGVVFAAFTWPGITGARRAESRAKEVATRRAALERLWSQVATRKEVVAQNRLDIESLSRDHLKSRESDLFAAQREIEKLAVDAGLKPKKSTYALEGIKDTGLVRCEITLPLDGSYSSLTGFLSRLESTKRFIVVDQLALAQDEEGARMNLKLSAIFQEGGARASR
jgi:Tfp pilus assembly protein PilO